MSDVHSVLSPTALFSSWRLSRWLLLWSQSISRLAFVSPLPPIFPAFLSFPENLVLSRCVRSKTASVLSLCLQWCSRLSLFALTHWCVFLGVQGVRRALPQREFQMNHFIPLSLCTVQLSRNSMHRNWEHEGVPGLSLGPNDTSMLLVTFPSSSIAALPSLGLLVTSWLQLMESVTGCIK